MLELKPPDWIIDPFSVDIDEVSLELQEELSDMHNDCEKKVGLKRWAMNGFGRKCQHETSSQMWKVANLLTLAFPTVSTVKS